MSNEWKVATLEQCKRLDELGVVIETDFWWMVWCKGDKTPPFVSHMPQRKKLDFSNGFYFFPAPDVAELGILLPCELGDYWSICIEKDDQHFIISYDGAGEVLGNKVFCEESEAQSRAAALIWLIENKRATWDQEKQMLIAV